MPIPYTRLIAVLEVAEALHDHLESLSSTARAIYTRASNGALSPSDALSELTLLCEHPPIRAHLSLLIEERTKYRLNYSKLTAERLRKLRRRQAAAGAPQSAAQPAPQTSAYLHHQQTLQAAIQNTQDSDPFTAEGSLESALGPSAPEALAEYLAAEFGNLPDDAPAPNTRSMTVGEAKNIIAKAWEG